MYRFGVRGFLCASTILLSTVSAQYAHSEEAGFVPPKVDSSKPTLPPIYPPAAQWKGEQGVTTVKLRISAAGKPKRFIVDRSSGFFDLDNAAVEAAMAWHYLPATRNGETTTDWITVDIKFQLPEVIQVPSPTPIDKNAANLVCRSDVGTTGTRLAQPAICRTQAEWDEYQRQAKQAKTDFDNKALTDGRRH